MDGWVDTYKIQGFFPVKKQKKEVVFIKNTKGGFSIYIIEHESIDFVNRNIRYGLNRPVISLR